ncbi:MAG TPA: hypothetical protein EYP35_08275 [Desulfobacterales bacterium]|nr:hypothetical protein [Desulfobacterales bacterium]
MKTKQRLGELLVEQKIVSQETVNDALRVQVGGNRRLGYLLIHMGAISEEQLADVLSQQLGIPFTNVDEAFSYDLKHLLPRYLCIKYGVIPLSLKKNNILLTAMADPSDLEAIKDIECYTGKVVEPCLARQSDINRAVRNKIPFSIKDILNTQPNTRLTRIIATAALALVVIFGISTYNYIETARHGSISHQANTTIYEHHNLMVGFDTSGKISFLGHSAFSQGYYSVEFNSIDTLKTLVLSRKSDFSSEQRSWLEWVLNKEKPNVRLKSSIASNAK